MDQISRFVIWLCSKFNREQLELIVKELSDILQGRKEFPVKPKDVFREKHPKGGTVEAATRLGEFLAKEASAKGITKVVFDRGGYLYHGRIKAVAEACRKGGLQF